MTTIISICISAVLFYAGQGAVAFLVIFGIVAKLLSPLLLTIVSLPGRLIAFPDDPDKHGAARYASGFAATIFAQSFVYLAYTALVVSWTISATQTQGTPPTIVWLIWLIAFLAVVVPQGVALNEFIESGKEIEDALKQAGPARNAISKIPFGNPKIFRMLSIATLTALLITSGSFLKFAYDPTIMKVIYGWLPHV